MDRIVVAGCGGSGKTTLARRLAARLQLPLTHLDALRYDRAWNDAPHEAFAEAQRQLVAADRWIIDGNSVSTLPIRLARADTVIVLDLAAVTCLAGIARRRLRYHGGQHDDGVYDRITWPFLAYVCTYRHSIVPRVRRLIATHAGHADVHIVRTRRAATRLAQQLGSELLGDHTAPTVADRLRRSVRAVRGRPYRAAVAATAAQNEPAATICSPSDSGTSKRA